MDRADAVLMDLRDFSKKRAGCAFELQQLGQRIDTRRLVLAVDASTDREFLATNLAGGGAAHSRAASAARQRSGSRARCSRRSLPGRMARTQRHLEPLRRHAESETALAVRQPELARGQ